MSTPTNLLLSDPIEFGVYDIPLQLPASLEPERASFRETLLAAQRRLGDFALKHKWKTCLKEPFAKLFCVYADKAAFDQNLSELCKLDPKLELPRTYCAALEQDVLMSVSPELYRSLYPEGDEKDSFEKLLTHEMAHRLHIRVLDGNEDAMGPVWFYEGFALYAASQFEKSAPQLTFTEIWGVVSEVERGEYRRYASVFRYFLGKASIWQLIEMAGKTEFVNWLKEICE